MKRDPTSEKPTERESSVPLPEERGEEERKDLFDNPRFRTGFFVFLFLNIGLELFAEQGEKAGLFSRATESVLNLAATSIWVAAFLLILYGNRVRGLTLKLLAAGICMTVVSQVIQIGNRFAAFRAWPLLGYESPLNPIIKDASQIVGVGFLLISVLSVILRTSRVKNQAVRAHADLKAEIERRRRIQEALHDSETRYHNIFDSADDIIYTIDFEGNVLALNQYGRDLSGFDEEEIGQLTIFDVVAPEYIDLVSARIKERMDGDPPTKYEIEYVTKGGERIPVELSSRVIKVDGEPIGVQGIARNITDRKKAERIRMTGLKVLEMIASGEPLERVLEAQTRAVEEQEDGMRCSILLLDAEGKHLRHAAGPSLPEDYNRYVDGMEIGPAAGSCGTAAYTGEPVVAADTYTDPRWKDFVDAAKRADLRSCWSYPITSSQGEVLGTFASYFSDVREPDDHYNELIQRAAHIASIAIERERSEKDRKSLEEQVRQAQKMESLGVLAGGIAHDFNNLLMGVLGNVSMAKLDLPPHSPVGESLDQIETAALRAADLAKQMLAYSGKGQFVLEGIDLSALLEEMSNLIEASISKNVTIRREFGDEPAVIEGDVTQIRQIAMNLITNASDATQEKGGVVVLKTGVKECVASDPHPSILRNKTLEGRYGYLEVIDTGCGMDEETQHKIFDPFFSTKPDGKGLGLSATLGIVRGHDGDIQLESRPGGGTTFRVLFPAFEGAISTDRPGYGEGEEGNLHGIVLVVDDEEPVRNVTRRMLERHGLEVLTARDGVEGVELFRERCDDISMVLLDMSMPRMNGDEAFREIVKIRTDARVVISSGYSEQDAALRFTETGLAGFLQKPYRVDGLLDKVREVIGPNGGAD